jgi:hypothetical protein
MKPLQRPSKSAAEVKALPPLGSTECSALMRDRGHSYAPETLVYVMREAIQVRATDLFELAFRLITGKPVGNRWEGGHCERTIASLSRAYGFNTNSELRLAFRSRCLVALADAVHAGSATKPYWEERFGAAFKDACIDVARSLSRPRNRDMEAGVASDDAPDVDEIEPAVELIDAELAKRLSQPHHESIVLQAIRALPRRQGQAVMLAWMEGRPIEGEVNDTVAKLMDISPRAVYKLLEKALPVLKNTTVLRAIWSGEV